MPYLQTSQQWLEQSTLLLQARPSTTRITTKYNLSSPPQASNAPIDPSATESSNRPEAPRATLVLKTYDPKSGATLKYKTTKQAEVSRLIQILGRLGRGMAGLPEKEDVVMGEGEAGSGVPEEKERAVDNKEKEGKGGNVGGGGAKKKKGKGKK